MTNLLKAMGFWIWGLLAIGLSISVLTVSHQLGIFARSPDGPAETHHSDGAQPAVSSTIDSDPVGSTDPAISRVIAGEMRAVQKAIGAQQWTQALQALDAALARETAGAKLTAYDDAKIQEFRAFVFFQLKQPRAAQEAYEKALANGGLSVEETVAVFKRLMALTASNQDYAQTILYARRAEAQGKLTPTEVALVARSYFLLHEYQNALWWADKAIVASRSGGTKPPENLLLFKLQAASDARDNPQVIAALFDLIRLTNKPTHWNTLLRIERQDERVDQNTLQLERLMFDTSGMTLDSDYIELAQLLGDADQPAEALMVLKSLLASKYLKHEHQERFERLLVEMDRRAAAGVDKPGPDVARSILLSNASEDARDSFGAPTAIEMTVTRRQWDRPEELSLYVARVLVAQGDFAGARKALQKFIESSSPKIASVWQLYADTLPEPKLEPEKPI